MIRPTLLLAAPLLVLLACTPAPQSAPPTAASPNPEPLPVIGNTWLSLRFLPDGTAPLGSGRSDTTAGLFTQTPSGLQRFENPLAWPIPAPTGTQSTYRYDWLTSTLIIESTLPNRQTRLGKIHLAPDSQTATALWFTSEPLPAQPPGAPDGWRVRRNIARQGTSSVYIWTLEPNEGFTRYRPRLGVGAIPTFPITPNPHLITLDGPPEDVEALAELQAQFHQFAPRVGTFGIGPFGSAHPRFQGDTFWDADIWMLPASLILAPETAAAITSYRLRTLPSPGQPVPWEAGPNGEDRTENRNVDQIHVTGGVAFGLAWASAFGHASPAQADSARQSAAAFYRTRLAPGPRLSLKGVISADEFRRVDDDLYTNAIAAWTLGQRPLLPADAEGLRNYASPESPTLQQVAALPAAFPLQDPEVEAQALALVNRYRSRITPNGPAMSASLEALLLARAGQSESALALWRESHTRYRRGPARLFSEKPTTAAAPFLTGIAGCLNTVLYGFAGLRIHPANQPAPNKPVLTIPLENNYVISVRPNLPPGWNKLTLTLTLDNQPRTLTITPNQVTLTPPASK